MLRSGLQGASSGAPQFHSCLLRVVTIIDDLWIKDRRSGMLPSHGHALEAPMASSQFKVRTFCLECLCTRLCVICPDVGRAAVRRRRHRVEPGGWKAVSFGDASIASFTPPSRRNMDEMTTTFRTLSGFLGNCLLATLK
jgi:hypothetical protein